MITNKIEIMGRSHERPILYSRLANTKEFNDSKEIAINKINNFNRVYNNKNETEEYKLKQYNDAINSINNYDKLINQFKGYNYTDRNKYKKLKEENTLILSPSSASNQIQKNYERSEKNLNEMRKYFLTKDDLIEADKLKSFNKKDYIFLYHTVAQRNVLNVLKIYISSNCNINNLKSDDIQIFEPKQTKKIKPGFVSLKKITSSSERTSKLLSDFIYKQICDFIKKRGLKSRQQLGLSDRSNDRNDPSIIYFSNKPWYNESCSLKIAALKKNLYLFNSDIRRRDYESKYDHWTDDYLKSKTKKFNELDPLISYESCYVGGIIDHKYVIK